MSLEARKRNPYVFESMKAKVNIPGISARCLQSKIQTKDKCYTATSVRDGAQGKSMWQMGF